MTDPATILEEAADILLTRGRCVGVGRNQRDEYCVLAAIALASGVDVADNENAIYEPTAACAALASAVRPVVIQWVGDHNWGWNADAGSSPATAQDQDIVWFWNDIVDHLDDFEVIDTLRHVAKDLRNGETG
jgi:predicted DNA-binding ribbon-helix-helix protein